jgi:hypothetical protein
MPHDNQHVRDDFRDDDLRNRFATLRREEEALAPQFAVPAPRRAAHVRRWSVGKVIAVTVCLATLAAAVFLLRPVPPKRQPGAGMPEVSLLEWRPHTDFLLQTPGQELLHSVPAIGALPDFRQPPRPRPKHPSVRKQVSS